MISRPSITICPSGKFTFADQGLAWDEVKEIRNHFRRAHPNRRPPTRVYKCLKCGYYHITKEVKRA